MHQDASHPKYRYDQQLPGSIVGPEFHPPRQGAIASTNGRTIAASQRIGRLLASSRSSPPSFASDTVSLSAIDREDTQEAASLRLAGIVRWSSVGSCALLATLAAATQLTFGKPEGSMPDNPFRFGDPKGQKHVHDHGGGGSSHTFFPSRHLFWRFVADPPQQAALMVVMVFVTAASAMVAVAFAVRRAFPRGHFDAATCNAGLLCAVIPAVYFLSLWSGLLVPNYLTQVAVLHALNFSQLLMQVACAGKHGRVKYALWHAAAGVLLLWLPVALAPGAWSGRLEGGPRQFDRYAAQSGLIRYLPAGVLHSVLPEQLAKRVLRGASGDAASHSSTLDALSSMGGGVGGGGGDWFTTAVASMDCYVRQRWFIYALRGTFSSGRLGWINWVVHNAAGWAYCPLTVALKIRTLQDFKRRVPSPRLHWFVTLLQLAPVAVQCQLMFGVAWPSA